MSSSSPTTRSRRAQRVAAPSLDFEFTRLCLVLQYLDARRDIPSAARVSKYWYAAACHPPTWRGSVAFRVDPVDGRLAVDGLRLVFASLQEMQSAVASRVYVNVAAITLPQLDRVASASVLARTLGQFRRLLSLTMAWRHDHLGNDAWDTLLGTDALACLQHLACAHVRALFSLSVLNYSSGPGPRPAPRVVACAATMRHLLFGAPVGVPLATLLLCARHLAAFVAQAPCLETATDVGGQTLMSLVERELGATATDVCLVHGEGGLGDFVAEDRQFASVVAGAGRLQPMLRRRQAWLFDWNADAACGRADWEAVVRVFPALVSLHLRREHVWLPPALRTLPVNPFDPARAPLGMGSGSGSGSSSDPGADFPLQAAAGEVSTATCQLRVLRVEATGHASEAASFRWLRQAGTLVSQLHTLCLPAHGSHDHQWASQFDALPHLTNLALDGLVLTTCEAFRRLPHLRLLRGVLWAPPSPPTAPTLSRCSEAAVGAAHFPSLRALDLRPSVHHASRFPSRDVYAFLAQLPCELDALDVETSDLVPRHLTDVRQVEDYVSAQHDADFAAATAEVALLPVRPIRNGSPTPEEDDQESKDDDDDDAQVLAALVALAQSWLDPLAGLAGPARTNT